MSGIPASPFADAMARFIQKNKGWKPIADAIPVGRRPGATSTGRPSTTGGASSAGGTVALKESNYGLREYHAKVVKTSSDGVLAFEIEPIAKVALVGDLSMEFEPPPA